MDERINQPVGITARRDRPPGMPRRGFLGFATTAIGGLIGLVLAVPGRGVCPVTLAEARQGGRLPDARPAQSIGGRGPAIVRDHRGAAGRLGQVSPRAGGLGLADPPEGGSRAPGDRVDVGVSPPGMCRQPDRRRQELPVPVPYQRVRPGAGSPQNQVPPRPMDRLDVEMTRATIPRSASNSSGSAPSPRRRSPLFKQLADWIDDRTGYRALMHEALDEPIPGGARWRYVFGSALTTSSS